MSPNIRAVFSSRPQLLVILVLLLLVLSAFVPGARAQMPNSVALMGLTTLRLPVPSGLVATTNITNYAHPMARLVGTTEHMDMPRPFRPRIVLLDPKPVVPPVATAPAKPDTAPVALGELTASSDEMRVLQLINKERGANGLKPLALDPILLRAARMHSDNMATKDFFNHVSPDGKTASERIKMCGMHGWRALGENIAYNQGFDDPVAFAVEQWMKSPMHRENMMNPMWSSTAVGIATAADGRIFFTELFLAR
jgi:uncharacterized protein YkwD